MPSPESFLLLPQLKAVSEWPEPVVPSRIGFPREEKPSLSSWQQHGESQLGLSGGGGEEEGPEGRLS